MRQGRHSRKDGWDREPSRSAERASVITEEERDPSKRRPGRKDKDYCKPAHGAHSPTMAKPSQYAKRACQWRLGWESRTRSWATEWLCLHEEQCGACGKVFRVRLSAEECPDWHLITPEQQRALDEEIARRVERREQWTSRKPAITGPQGYRRKRTS